MRESFDRIHADGAKNGRLLVLNVHPWITGQPYRIRYFEDAMRHIAAHTTVWKATGSEVVDWHRKVAPAQR